MLTSTTFLPRCQVARNCRCPLGCCQIPGIPPKYSKIMQGPPVRPKTAPTRSTTSNMAPSSDADDDASRRAAGARAKAMPCAYFAQDGGYLAARMRLRQNRSACNGDYKGIAQDLLNDVAAWANATDIQRAPSADRADDPNDGPQVCKTTTNFQMPMTLGPSRSHNEPPKRPPGAAQTAERTILLCKTCNKRSTPFLWAQVGRCARKHDRYDCSRCGRATPKRRICGEVVILL